MVINQVFYLAQLNGVVAVEVMNSSSAAPTLELNIHQADFPVDFFIGVGTSAAQVHTLMLKMVNLLVYTCALYILHCQKDFVM